MPSSHLCHLLLLMPSIFPSIRIFSSEALCIRCQVLELQHQSFQWYSGLLSFRVDWFDLLAVQGTLKNLLQHYNLKASILRCSAFFTVQLSHLYMTAGKTLALTIWSFVGKVMSLLFNTLSRFVIDFLPKSKCLLISWLQPPSAVILEPKKIKSVTVSTFSPFTCHEMMEPDAMILGFWSYYVYNKKRWLLRSTLKDDSESNKENSFDDGRKKHHRNKERRSRRQLTHSRQEGGKIWWFKLQALGPANWGTNPHSGPPLVLWPWASCLTFLSLAFFFLFS